MIRSVRALWTRLRDWMQRDRLDRELDEELRFHQAMIARDAGAHGSRRLGNLTRLREEVRAMWGFAWLEVMEQDVRYAIRGLRRSPGFAATVIITLGLGIGANVGMFSVVDRLMIRPLAYLRDPGTVHRVYLKYFDRGREFTDGTSLEYKRYLELKSGTSSFAQSAAFAQRELAVGVGEDARERQVATVSASFFDFFRAQPVRGRFFSADEDVTPRGADVAVISYNCWRAHFGGRDDVIGQTLQVGNIPARIIGVAPRGFAAVEDDQPAEVFIPITTYAGSQPDQMNEYATTFHWGWMAMLVRRKAGVSVDAANADLSRAYLASWNAERAAEPSLAPASDAKPRAVVGAVRRAGGPDPGLESRTALWTSGVALIVLLIACANVANLLLARALRRRREIAVRLALGVSRRRLTVQCLTESLMLALAASVAGIAVADVSGAALTHLFVSDAEVVPVITDWRAIGFAVATALVAGIVTGLAPAWLAGRGELAATLKAGAREGSYQRSWIRSMLLVSQAALSVMLLVGAGLFVRSLNRARSMRLGFDPDQVLLVNENLRGMQLGDTAKIVLGRRLLEGAQRIPGVEHATWTGSVPFWSSSSMQFFVAGIDSVRRLGRFTYYAATPDFFATMGTRILRGRSFTTADDANAPGVAVVSEKMASVLWPGRDALGQCMRIRADTMPCTTVIGIAENAAQRSLADDDARMQYYLPIEQFHPEAGFALLLRVRGDPARVAENIRKQLQGIMPGASYLTAQPLAAIVSGVRRSWQVGATMFVAFGGLALLVAAVGLYGVISYNVAQRTHELGVRVALGAQRRDVARLVIGSGLRVTAAGVCAGCALALLAGSAVEPLLFHESPRDPVVFVAVSGLLLAVALAATAVPAQRASRADPNLALRSE